MPFEIAVVGAGIGGLTAALALASRGHRVTLLEERTAFSEVGAGLQLSPNASRILIELGLGPAVRRAAGEPERVAVRSLASGRAIGGIALGPAMRERFAAPYFVIHRADLQTILLDAVRSRANVRLLVGRSVGGLDLGGRRPMLLVEGRGRESVAADLVVAADGIGSTFRKEIGEFGEPAFQGAAAWRALVPREEAPPELAGNETGLWLGAGRHVVHYPIAGGRTVNVVAIAPQATPVPSWSAEGDPAELAHAFKDAAAPLRALLGCAPAWRLWSLFDRPAGRLARGRLALLGDAAHPTLPYLAQGAAMAIEDAAVLAACLETADADPALALAAYDKARGKRVRRVQSHARRNGRVYHAGPLLALARNLVLRRLGPNGMLDRYAWLYGWRPPEGA